jgi:hypothetical protein
VRSSKNEMMDYVVCQINTGVCSFIKCSEVENRTLQKQKKDQLHSLLLITKNSTVDKTPKEV